MQPIISAILLLFLFGMPYRAAAQQPFICRDVLSSAGAYATSAGRHFEMTLGEPVIKSLGNNFARLSQGFTQPEVCPLILVNNQEPQRMHSFALYPNPVEDRLHLRVEASFSQHLQMQLFDAVGRSYGTPPFLDVQGELQLDCSGLGSGAYFLVLRSDDGRQVLTLPFIRQGH